MPEPSREPTQERSRAWVRPFMQLRRSFVRFVLLGIWNALWSFALYAVLVHWLEWNYLVSLGIVWTAGFLVSYCANYLWVFETGRRLRFDRNALRYLLLFWGTFFANVALLWAMVERAGAPPVLAQALVIPAVILLHYGLARFWAFRAAPGRGDA